jgi:hypothetical protein
MDLGGWGVFQRHGSLPVFRHILPDVQGKMPPMAAQPKANRPRKSREAREPAVRQSESLRLGLGGLGAELRREDVD